MTPVTQTDDALLPTKRPGEEAGGSIPEAAAPQLHYYDMSGQVVAFSTTRRGGHSRGSYGSFNINPYCGDDESAILRNRAALCRLLDISDAQLLMPHQTHQTRVARIDAAFLHLSGEARKRALQWVDALMTDLQGICIGVSTADCIPLLLYDERHHAVCAVHAGWRGTVARIARQAVAAMRQAYGTDPADLRVQIGPGIGLEAFEVGQDVYDAFREAGFPMADISRRHEKWHINLPECNRLQLMAEGVDPAHINDCGICTFSQPAQFFSARRLGIRSGRIYTAIMLRAADGTEWHPLAPFLPPGARVLFLGSFPPPLRRWCMDFFYPNFNNDHWKIEGEVFFGDPAHFVLQSEPDPRPGRRPPKTFDREAIVAFCRQQGIAFFDTAMAVRRLRGNASDEHLEVVQPTDILALLAQLPHCQVVAVTGQKAADTLCRYFGISEGPKIGTSIAIPGTRNTEGHPLRLHRLPSSSRAYPLAFGLKAAAYRAMFAEAGM